MPYIVIATIRAKSAEAAQAIAKHLKAIEADVKINEPNTLMYIPTQSAEDPQNFSIIEEYTEEAAQLKHREGEPYKVFKSELPGLMEGSLGIQKFIKC